MVYRVYQRNLSTCSIDYSHSILSYEQLIRICALPYTHWDVTEKEMVKIDPQIAEQSALEVQICILICADLAGYRSNDDLLRAQAGSNVNYLSPRLVNTLGRTPGNF